MLPSNSELLEELADLLEGNWCRLNFTSPQGRHCLVGGIQQLRRKYIHRHSYGEAEAIFARVCPAISMQINDDRLIHWNDYIAKDEQEVLDAVRGAAKAERMKEENFA